MTSWRASDIAYDDPDAGISSAPATAGKYVGAAFQQQTAYGANLTDDEDRVTYEASIATLTDNIDAHGLGADYATGTPGNPVVFGNKEDVWYDTLRPNAGFPLPIVGDVEYGNATNDVMGDTVNEDIGNIADPNVYSVPEKPKQYPSRVSAMPAEIQHTRPWDILMGMFPWSGAKVALQRPSATTPITFEEPITDAIPSPGGSAADVPNTPNFSPYPLTFRAPPAPWDTANDGEYVDSGL